MNSLNALQLTRFEKLGGPLTKRIYLDDTGKCVSDGSACVMTSGRAYRERLADLAAAADLISEMPSVGALALGRLRGDLPDVATVTTQARLSSLNGSAPPDLIARTADFIKYEAGQPALALIDVDTKGMPPGVAARIEAAGGYWEALCCVLAALSKTARIVRSSTSTGLSRADTGSALPGSRGLHIYLHVRDGTDIERFLYALHDRCWLTGFGWHMIGAGGQLLDRSLVDRMVFAAERLVFEGAPVVVAPLVQDSAARRAVVHEGEPLATAEACPPLRIVESADLKALKAKSAQAMAPARAAEKERFVTSRASVLAAERSIPQATARRIIERQCEGILRPDVALAFDDPDLSGARVCDVLANPEAYVGATLADPLEGVSYGRTKAKIMRRADGSPWINSFAHGRTVYELKLDAIAAREAIADAPADQMTDLFVSAVVSGDLDPAEIEDLRNHVAEATGIGRRTITAKLRAAQKGKADAAREERRTRRAAERMDTRPQIEAPALDAPWLPVMDALNDVLSSSKAAEPPMRDLDGVMVAVRVRRVPALHCLSASGSNEGETQSTRLPAPEQPLLTRLDEVQLAELIESHIDFADEDGKPVHLGGAFVKHYHTRSDNVLPLATSIATLPLVTPAGTLLSRPGLDRDRSIVFRIPPEMLALVPDPNAIAPGRVKAAMDFLVNDWLCDVLTDAVGKSVLVCAALTIIERALLPERPAFFVTAGRRGGGKTTILSMLLSAVTGSRPSAAAWSPNEEERRKSLLSYLMEGLPAIVYDNVPRGAQLSCPHIEKALTASLYSDRVLGVSQTVTVPSSTVLMFTGNNIAPKGDMSSRSLKVHLDVDRADPENRPFRHPDPVAWTEANRGKILRALYVILLGNPNRAQAPETRFKTWWRLVGSAVEHAAGEIGAKFNFKDLFLHQEEDDEEGGSLFDVLAALRGQSAWKEKGFGAVDLARFLNDQGERGPAEMERCALVKEFLFPNGAAHAVTAKAASNRLRKHVGDPVARDGETLTLRAAPDTHTKVLTFNVVPTR